MSNSLSDQLLKAGLITQDQIDKSEQDKQQRKARAKSRPVTGKQANKPGSHNKSGIAAKNTASAPAAPTGKKKPAKKSNSDLAKFYQQRNQLEREERETEERLKREAAARRKKVRQQLRELVTASMQNTEDASIRFNFVVGEKVKYLYVTELQQEAIAEGKLSITFMDGKRCLVAPEIGEQILALDDSKIVINFRDDNGDTAMMKDAPDNENEEPTLASAPPVPDSATEAATSDRNNH